MKIAIASTIPISQRWLDEVKTFIPDATFSFQFVTALPTTYYRPEMQSMYCDFNSVRAIVDSALVDARIYIMSYDQLRALGITNHLALYDNSDRDGVLDTYIGLNTRELDTRALANGFRSNFAWEVCHELSHGREQDLGREYLATNGDETHAKEAQGKLKALWYDDTVQGLQAVVAKLTHYLSFLLSKKTMIHPVPLPYRNQITQQYGVENPIYKRTGHHIGSDYACPVGTPVVAPADGSLIMASHSPERGNYVQFAHGNYVLEMRHLSQMMPVGDYRQGAVIAHSGNTGTLTEGPHVCVVDWIGHDGLAIINRTNWASLTVDPNKLYS